MMDSPTNLSSKCSLTVLIVCATWCGVCRDYKSVIELECEHEIKPVWVDVDDFEALADDLSIETFPTIVILRDSGVLFFGSIDTKQGTLSGLLSAVSEHPPIPQYQELGDLIREQLIR
jgi:thioredoxin 1